MVYGYLDYQSTLNGGLKITSFVLFEHFFQVGSKKPPSINVSHFYALITWILLFLVSGDSAQWVKNHSKIRCWRVGGGNGCRYKNHRTSLQHLILLAIPIRSIVWYIYLHNQMSTWDAVGNLGMIFFWESIFSTNPNCSTRLETSFRVALAFPLWLSPPAAAFSCFEKALGQADGCRFPPEVSEFGVATKFVESSLESAERIRPPKQAGRTWRIILGRT